MPPGGRIFWRKHDSLFGAIGSRNDGCLYPPPRPEAGGAVFDGSRLPHGAGDTRQARLPGRWTDISLLGPQTALPRRRLDRVGGGAYQRATTLNQRGAVMSATLEKADELWHWQKEPWATIRGWHYPVQSDAFRH